jgi:asparagine synthase (glutamine-hydrolysing)
MTALAAVLGDGAHADAVRTMLDAAGHRGVEPRAIASGPAVLGWRVSSRRRGLDPSPYASAPSGAAIVFDGRLHNRDDLERALNAPPDDSDAALALRAYEKWGDGAPGELLGDFAFAVWDPRAPRLLCARDAFAQRPLFYALVPGRALVASEPQQILAHPGFPAVPNEGVLAEYLSGNPATVDETIWSGILRLPAAHAVSLSPGGGVRRWRFWDFDPDARLEYARDEEYDEHFLSLLRAAVECRIGGASAVGVYLSGGLDSSILAGCAETLARERGIAPVRAYSVTFPGLAADESPFIDAVVEQWRLASFRTQGRAGTRAGMEQYAARFRDLPAYPNGTVLDPLRERAATDVDVILGGSGGDEWFTGSPLHTADLLRRGRVIAALRQLRADRSVPRFGFTAAYLLRTAAGPLLPAPARAMLRPFFGGPRPAYEWIRGDFAARVALADRLRWRGLPRSRTLVQSEMRMLAGLLMQTAGEELEDRANSIAKVENGNPFYDRRLVEFGFALPETQRWQGGETKVLLRRACAPMLPARVRERNDKAEFSCVFQEALTELGGRSFFENLAAAEAGWVDGGVVARMYDRMMGLYTDGLTAYISLVMSLWGIASVELWLRHGRDGRIA